MPLRSLQALCLLNFFMADVRDGLGPFLGIYLTQRHWSPDAVGWVMSDGGLAGLVATLPAELVADACYQRRLLLITGSLIIAGATLLLWYVPGETVVLISQAVTGFAAAFIGPLLTAVTLGLTGPEEFGRQMGRNEVFNHAGNLTAALVAGAAVWAWGLGSVFALMTVMATLAGLCVVAIRQGEIDNQRARGLMPSQLTVAIPRFSLIVREPALMITGVTLLLFHLGNAALLPMLSIRLHPHQIPGWILVYSRRQRSLFHRA